MNNTITVKCFEPVQAHKALGAVVWPFLKANLQAGNEMIVTVKPKTRSTEQNSRLWAMLTEISQQVDWHGRKLSPEDWKHVFSASLQKLDVVPNLDSTGFVALGLSTSRMTVAQMCDMQTLMEAFGAEHGIKFTEPEQ